MANLTLTKAENKRLSSYLRKITPMRRKPKLGPIVNDLRGIRCKSQTS